MNPALAWDTYVGEQTVAEFIALGGDPDDYALRAPACLDLTDEERSHVARLLAEYIAQDGGPA